MADTDEGAIWIGFDLGGTKMMSLVLDNNFKVLARVKKKTKSQEEELLGIDRIIKVIKTSISEYKDSPVKIAGIGLGVPGILDLNKGVILEAPNLGWKKMPVQELIEKEFSCPVVISNDVDAGVFGEYTMGAAKNFQSVLGVFPGTGIGGGFIYKGDIFTGKNNSCMEIGHITVNPNGMRCGCGRRGCLETVASRLAISAAATVAVFRGEAPNLQKIAGTDIANVKSNALAQAIKAGDQSIDFIVRQAAFQLGISIGSVINILTPEAIVLGGGLVEAMPEIYTTEVASGIKQSVMPSFEKLITLLTAKLGDDATAIGAAAWAKKRMTQNKK
jgi:glucokinase